MRTLVCTFFLLIASLCNNTFAQNENVKYYNIDVKGIPIGAKISESILLEKFGNPTKIEKKESEFGVALLYYYGDSYLRVENGNFVEFTIYDPKFPIMTEYFKGGIRVGAQSSIFDDFEYGELEAWNEEKGYYWLVDDSDSFLSLTIENDIIIDLHFHYNP